MEVAVEKKLIKNFWSIVTFVVSENCAQSALNVKNQKRLID